MKTEEGVTIKQNVAEQLESALASTQPANPPEKEKASRFGFPQNNNHNVADYRSLVKTLVCGVKTIAWSLPSCKIQVGL